MICLPPQQFLLLPFTLPLAVLPAAHKRACELGGGGGLGTACAPHNLAMWLHVTPRDALCLCWPMEGFGMVVCSCVQAGEDCKC